MPHIVVLNGVSSVGKSSTAKAIQAIARLPFLHIQMDAFLEMLPPRSFDMPDGLVFDRRSASVVDVKAGPLVNKTLLGMRHAVAAMARCGNHIVVDDVWFGHEDAEYRDLLGAFDLHLVGLHAPLDIVQQRELARGDREIGLAKGQIDRVHRDRNYDLQIETAHKSPEQVAREICTAFDL